MGAAGVLGLIAKSKFDAANDRTGAPRHADSVHAGQMADAATVVLAVGAAATAAGAVIWLTAPRARVSVGVNVQGVTLSGNFQ